MKGFRKRSISSVGRKYEDYFVIEKLHNLYFTTKFYKGFKADLHTHYGYLWRTGQVYYDLMGMFGSWKVYLFPVKGFKLKECLKDIQFEKKDLQPGGNIFLALSFVAANKDCQKVKNHVQKIKLLVINDDSSDQYTIEVSLDEGYHHHNHTGKGKEEYKQQGRYAIPFMFNSHYSLANRNNNELNTGPIQR